MPTSFNTRQVGKEAGNKEKDQNPRKFPDMPVVKTGAIKIQERQSLVLAEGIRESILEVKYTVEFKSTNEESSRRWKFQVKNSLNGSWWMLLQELSVYPGRIKLEWGEEKLCSGW